MAMPDHHAIREAALDLILDLGHKFPTPEEVAERANVPLADVQHLAPTDETLFGFLLRPFVDSVDAHLKELPIHQTPTLGQQREILDGILCAATENPRQLALVIFLLADKKHKPFSVRSDRFAYQSGLRLLGADYDHDPEKMSRVYLASELLAIAVVSRRHDLHDAQFREILLDSLLGVINPPSVTPSVTDSPQRRWNDAEGDPSQHR